MNKKFILTAIFSLFLAVLTVSAQDKKTDFSGTWELDVAKSKLGERMRVESMTLTVSQTEKELKVESVTKRPPRPEGAPAMGGGAMMGRGGMGGGFGGDATRVFTLDGKESSIPGAGQMGGSETLKAEMETGGKLKLNSTRTISSQMGEMSIKTKESWTLSADGKTLTIVRDMETPRGTNSSEMVFNKK